MKKMNDDERFVPLEGSINFRDFGGYVTEDGQLVKRNLLYRSGALANLTADAHEAFSRLGIDVICDLRRDEEVERSPTPTHPPFDCRRHIPINPGSTGMLAASLEDRSQSERDRVQFMVDLTRELARDHHDEYRELFSCLLEVDGAFLLHCSAGKDRTGFGAALILSALGVPEETIVTDYLLTNQANCLRAYMAPRMQAFYGYEIDAGSIEAVAGVREDYIRAALDEVSKAHGSVDRYLHEIGVDVRARAALRERLLVRPLQAANA